MCDAISFEGIFFYFFYFELFAVAVKGCIDRIEKKKYAKEEKKKS